jgi:hypothetical protein
MAKNGQRASWESDHYKSPKKSKAASVPEVSKESKRK